jgi:hypothetical protein
MHQAVAENSKRSNLITSFGLFWRLDETEWQGKAGARGRAGLFGRRGTRNVDFWSMPGVYVLYGNFGAYYSGITTKQGVGQRIRQHSRSQKHRGKFDRFSWFGFGEISGNKEIYMVEQPRKVKPVSWSKVTNDIEAILHRAFPFRGNPAGFGVRKGDPFKVEEWEQLPREAVARLKGRTGGSS